MPASYTCDVCGKYYELTDDWRGQNFLCTGCGTKGFVSDSDRVDPEEQQTRPDMGRKKKKTGLAALANLGTGDGLVELPLDGSPIEAPAEIAEEPPPAEPPVEEEAPQPVRRRRASGLGAVAAASRGEERADDDYFDSDDPGASGRRVLDGMADVAQSMDFVPVKKRYVSVSGIFLIACSIGLFMYSSSPDRAGLPQNKSPQRISVNDLGKFGPRDNGHIVITDPVFSPDQPFIADRDDEGNWIATWIPLVAKDIKGEEPMPLAVRTVLYCHEVKSEAAIKTFRRYPSVEGVINVPPQKIEPMLPEDFRDADPSKSFRGLWVVEVGDSGEGSGALKGWSKFLGVLCVLGAIAMLGFGLGVGTIRRPGMSIMSTDSKIEYMVCAAVIAFAFVARHVEMGGMVAAAVLGIVAVGALIDAGLEFVKHQGGGWRGQQRAATTFMGAVLLAFSGLVGYAQGEQTKEEKIIGARIAKYDAGSLDDQYNASLLAMADIGSAMVIKPPEVDVKPPDNGDNNPDNGETNSSPFIEEGPELPQAPIGSALAHLPVWQPRESLNSSLADAVKVANDAFEFRPPAGLQINDVGTSKKVWTGLDNSGRAIRIDLTITPRNRTDEIWPDMANAKLEPEETLPLETLHLVGGEGDYGKIGDVYFARIRGAVGTGAERKWICKYGAYHQDLYIEITTSCAADDASRIGVLAASVRTWSKPQGVVVKPPPPPPPSKLPQWKVATAMERYLAPPMKVGAFTIRPPSLAKRTGLSDRGAVWKSTDANKRAVIIKLRVMERKDLDEPLPPIINAAPGILRDREDRVFGIPTALVEKGSVNGMTFVRLTHEVNRAGIMTNSYVYGAYDGENYIVIEFNCSGGDARSISLLQSMAHSIDRAE